MLLILLVLAGMLFLSLERTESKAPESQQTSTPAATKPSSPVAAVSQE